MALSKKDKRIIYTAILIPLIISIYRAFWISAWFGLLNLAVGIVWIWSYKSTARLMNKYGGFTKSTGQVIKVVSYLSAVPIVIALLLWNLFLGLMITLIALFGLIYFSYKNCAKCTYYCPFNHNPEKKFKL